MKNIIHEQAFIKKFFRHLLLGLSVFVLLFAITGGPLRGLIAFAEDAVDVCLENPTDPACSGSGGNSGGGNTGGGSTFTCRVDNYGPMSNKSQWCRCAAQNNDIGSLMREGCPQAPQDRENPSQEARTCDDLAVNNAVCGQRGYDTCSPACTNIDPVTKQATNKGFAIYHCQASQNSKCQGDIYCAGEDDRCEDAGSPICAQVITPAKNLTTGKCKTFPNSCLPPDWRPDASCGYILYPQTTNNDNNTQNPNTSTTMPTTTAAPVTQTPTQTSTPVITSEGGGDDQTQTQINQQSQSSSQSQSVSVTGGSATGGSSSSSSTGGSSTVRIEFDY